MTLDEMKKKKSELGYTNEMLARLSGVPLSTVQKYFSGNTKSPRYDTLQAMQKVLFGPGPDRLSVHEEAAYYAAPAQESDPSALKTIDDYLALPEGTRIELIDGRFYDMAAPTTLHQGIGGEIYHILKSYIADNKGQCIPFTAPTDVQLDCDDKTMLQPDVLVVCDRKKITKARIVGAPDFVVEVISPSHVVTDIFVKKEKYRKAGVREYWIVFPEEKQVMVYDFEKSELPVHYTSDEVIPVAIWNGSCSVDFRSVCEQMSFLF